MINIFTPQRHNHGFIYFKPYCRNLPPVFPELFIKLDRKWKNIILQKYVDDILIIFNQNKTNKNSTMNHMNNIHKYVEFKLTVEENNINYLDLTIPRHNNNLSTGIHR
jgi:aspartyl aminopeptidase